MQTLFDWASRYNYSVPGEPRVQCISKREMCCMCFFIDCQANISEGRNRGMNVQFMLSKKKGPRCDEFHSYKTASKMHLCCSSAYCWTCYLGTICILFECISAFSNGCNSSMWTLSNKYLKCSVEKSHFRVQWLFWSCSSGQLWNIRPCKACLFNQFPYFQLLTLLLVRATVLHNM